MKKSEIETRDGFPAVNVKVYGNVDKVKLPLDMGGSAPADDPTNFTWHTSDPAFTHDWIDAHVNDVDEIWWDVACSDGWESLDMEAERIFGRGVKVYQEGRSGGWAVVHGLDDVESWDAIAVSRWSRFAHVARAIADDIPRSMVWLLYVNEFENIEETEET